MRKKAPLNQRRTRHRLFYWVCSFFSRWTALVRSSNKWVKCDCTCKWLRKKMHERSPEEGPERRGGLQRRGRGDAARENSRKDNKGEGVSCERPPPRKSPPPSTGGPLLRSTSWPPYWINLAQGKFESNKTWLILTITGRGRVPTSIIKHFTVRMQDLRTLLCVQSLTPLRTNNGLGSRHVASDLFATPSAIVSILRSKDENLLTLDLGSPDVTDAPDLLYEPCGCSTLPLSASNQ